MKFVRCVELESKRVESLMLTIDHQEPGTQDTWVKIISLAILSKFEITRQNNIGNEIYKLNFFIQNKICTFFMTIVLGKLPALNEINIRYSFLTDDMNEAFAIQQFALMYINLTFIILFKLSQFLFYKTDFIK